MIISNNLIEKARKMAEKASPFSFVQNGKIYTGVFDTSEWVYKCYEDGIWLVNFNIKSKPQCIKSLKEWML